VSENKPWREVSHGLLKDIERIQEDIKDIYEKVNQARIDIAVTKGKLVVYVVVAGFASSTIVSVLFQLIRG